jgi:hypothetical protein
MTGIVFSMASAHYPDYRAISRRCMSPVYGAANATGMLLIFTVVSACWQKRMHFDVLRYAVSG